MGVILNPFTGQLEIDNTGGGGGTGNVINTGASVAGQVPAFTNTDGSNVHPSDLIIDSNGNGALNSIAAASVPTIFETNSHTRYFTFSGDGTDNLYAQGQIVLVNQASTANDTTAGGISGVAKNPNGGALRSVGSVNFASDSNGGYITFITSNSAGTAYNNAYMGPGGFFYGNPAATLGNVNKPWAATYTADLILGNASPGMYSAIEQNNSATLVYLHSLQYLWQWQFYDKTLVSLDSMKLQLDNRVFTLAGVDNAVNDSVISSSAVLRSANKTAGTGNSGTTTIDTGTSAGGTVGNVLIKTGGSTRATINSTSALFTTPIEAKTSLLLDGATSGTFTQSAPSTVTSYAVTWPSTQGSASTVLTNNGSGALSWATAASGGVTGPGSSINNSISTYNGTGGSTIQDSGTMYLLSTHNALMNATALFSNTLRSSSTRQMVLASDGTQDYYAFGQLTTVNTSNTSDFSVFGTCGEWVGVMTDTTNYSQIRVASIQFLANGAPGLIQFNTRQVNGSSFLTILNLDHDHMYPAADNSMDLGRDVLAFKNAYFNAITTNTIDTQSGGILNLNSAGAAAFTIDGSQILNNKKSANESTGSGTALLGSNSPAVTNTAPYTWLKVKTSDGSTGYIPIWK